MLSGVLSFTGDRSVIILDNAVKLQEYLGGFLLHFLHLLPLLMIKSVFLVTQFINSMNNFGYHHLFIMPFLLKHLFFLLDYILYYVGINTIKVSCLSIVLGFFPPSNGSTGVTALA